MVGSLGCSCAVVDTRCLEDGLDIHFVADGTVGEDTRYLLRGPAAEYMYKAEGCYSIVSSAGAAVGLAGTYCLLVGRNECFVVYLGT